MTGLHETTCDILHPFSGLFVDPITTPSFITKVHHSFCLTHPLPPPACLSREMRTPQSPIRTITYPALISPSMHCTPRRCPRIDPPLISVCLARPGVSKQSASTTPALLDELFTARNELPHMHHPPKFNYCTLIIETLLQCYYCPGTCNIDNQALAVR